MFSLTVLFVASVVDADIDGKLLFGYQGWFGAPGDGSQFNGWKHWSRGEPACDTLTVGRRLLFIEMRHNLLTLTLSRFSSRLVGA